MARLTICGERPLSGAVTVSGSKNSALPILVAAGLARSESVLENIPRVTDVWTISMILRQLGVEVWLDDAGRFHVNGAGLSSYQAPYEHARRMRASIYVAGLLLARLSRAEVPLPGGCAIGSRPVDFHIKGFQQLGVAVSTEHGFLKATAPKLAGSTIYINRASVGTTINLMLAATLAEGVTVLENAAKEPEIVDLSIYLNAMGATVRGAGTDVIRIEGVQELTGTSYSIIPDRIEAGTFMIAAGITGGDVTLLNLEPEHLRSPIRKLQEAGVQVTEGDTSIRVAAPQRVRAVDVETAVYPGFITDLQQPFVSLMAVADGTSVIRETVFDSRFRYIDELRRMGADIRVDRDTAIVRGVERLTGAPVEATDLRAGAALVVAGLAASGETELTGIEHVDRGYEHLTDKLTALGACIRREEGDASDGTVSFDELRRDRVTASGRRL